MPAVPPTSSSTRCWRASWCICATSRRAFRVIDTHAGAGLYDLRGPEASRSPRMARRHRPPADGADRRPRRARCSRPISTRSRALNPGERARRLSRLACAGARAAAQPGPPDRLRARAERGGRAHAQPRPRPARQSDRDRRLDRAQRLCAAAGAARSGADRPAVRGRRRVLAACAGAWKPRIANGRPASSCSGTRSRDGRTSGRAGAAPAALGDPQGAAGRSRFRSAARAGGGSAAAA